MRGLRALCLASAVCAVLPSAVRAESDDVVTDGILPVAGRATAAAEAAPLDDLVYQAVEINKLRNLDIQRNRPWEILHGLLALRNDYMIRDGNRTIRAIDWISSEARFKGARWFEATPDGAKAHPYNGTPYDFEGHVNQTLSILSMCDLPRDHVFHLDGGKTVTMQDMIHHAQMNINVREEVSWTLWFLTHYVDQDAQWTMTNGQPMSMEMLVRKQITDPPYNAPCGGCHGLFALAYACNSYRQKHGQLHGTWLEGEQKLKQFVAAAKSMQNPDGSFATQFFKARGYSNQFNERIKSTGHMLEWLMVALPKSQLDEEWIQRGVRSLAVDLIRNATQPADCGPLYHSLHALILYQHRRGTFQTPTAPVEVATVPAVSGPVTLSEPDEESQPRSMTEADTTESALAAAPESAVEHQPVIKPDMRSGTRSQDQQDKLAQTPDQQTENVAETGSKSGRPIAKLTIQERDAAETDDEQPAKPSADDGQLASTADILKLAPATGCMPIFTFLELGMPIPEESAESSEPVLQADLPTDQVTR